VPELWTLDGSKRMTDQIPSASVVSPLRKLWRCVLSIIGVTVVANFIAITFFHINYMCGFIDLPGVIISIASACFCCSRFFVYPRHPVWAKALVLLLIVPSLFYAVFSTASYICMILWTGTYWAH